MSKLRVGFAFALLIFWLSAFFPSQAASQDATSLNAAYKDAADRIIRAALADKGAWDKLEYICDRIGPRLSGSSQYDESVKWAAAAMKQDGLANVATPPVRIPRWVRGLEEAYVVQPVRRRLHILGLGGTVPTPAAGLTAELVVARSFDELQRLGAGRVAGKIVLLNPPYEGYGKSVRYRVGGASQAARLGALAVLSRSITPESLQSPHTGMLAYDSGVSQIPAAAVSVEDADYLERLSTKGQNPTIQLRIESKSHPDVDSAYVIGELPGRERPEEIVLIGAHLDSWDVGQGAHDDAGGCVVAMQAASLLRQIGLQPRRTIRVVLFANEENGMRGAAAYRELVQNTVRKHVAAIELDAGMERPTALAASFTKLGQTSPERSQAFDMLKQIARLLEPVGTNQVFEGGGGADISPLMREGVPGLSIRNEGLRYFSWHHSEADTLDKVDPESLRKNLATAAVVLYVLAEMPLTLPQGPIS